MLNENWVKRPVNNYLQYDIPCQKKFRFVRTLLKAEKIHVGGRSSLLATISHPPVESGNGEGGQPACPLPSPHVHFSSHSPIPSQHCRFTCLFPLCFVLYFNWEGASSPLTLLPSCGKPSPGADIRRGPVRKHDRKLLLISYVPHFFTNPIHTRFGKYSKTFSSPI